MEIGAVKQAFNNELILLKKKLNQAKIQIIHKLTRKAKTLVTDKKVPEQLKEKFIRKAQSAVNEVLIIKKINPKDIARFAVTHKGQLNDYLNKPIVDRDKACARLLLHKSLQDKYKLIRVRFSSVPIDDLLMSREDRQKLKKEAREKQQNKRKEKENKAKGVVNAEGDWDVEDVVLDDTVKEQDVDEDNSEINEDLSESEEEKATADSKDSNQESENDGSLSSNESVSESNDELLGTQNNEDKNEISINSGNESKINEDKYSLKEVHTKSIVSNPKQTIKLKSNKYNKVEVPAIDVFIETKPIVTPKPPLKSPINKSKEKNKQNKNKNLKEKLLSRTFKKESEEAPIPETKVVDPFFITSSGENYMSVVEPRPADEVKEVHKQGNRKLRRAVMFGHVPKFNPRQNYLKSEENRFNNHNGYNKSNKTKRFDNGSDFSDNNKNNTDKRNKFERTEEEKAVPEKLHPSWEAKKRQSGIQPFQGKKIKFDES